MQILQNETTVALKRIPVYLVLASDGVTPATGITVSAGDIKLIKPNTTTEINHSGTLDECGAGWYWYTPTTAELDTLGRLGGVIKPATVDPFPFAVEIIANSPFVVNVLTARQLGIVETDVCPANTAANTVPLKVGTKLKPGDLIDFTSVLDGIPMYNIISIAGTSPPVATVSPNLDAALVTQTPNYIGRVGVNLPTGANAPSVQLTAQGLTALFRYVLQSGDYGTVGSAAEALHNASAAGDPWNTLLPGSYGAGRAGNILGNNLNATVSSRSTYSGGAVTLDPTEHDQIADAILNRNIRGGSYTGRRVFEALGYLRNRVAINKDVSPPVMTIYDIDDTTPLYTAVLSQSSTFDPVLSIDPAGP
jgi:hypothetical protein